MAGTHAGTLAFTSLERMFNTSVFDKLHFGIVDSIDTLKATMEVALNGDPQKILPPIHITFSSIGANYGLRAMPEVGEIVVLYKYKDGFVHLGSVFPAHEKFIRDLDKPIDELVNGNMLNLRSAEIGIESVNDQIHLRRGDGILISSAHDLFRNQSYTDRQVHEQATQFFKETVDQRSEFRFGRVRRTDAESEKNLETETYLGDSASSGDFDEFHIALSRPVVAGEVITENTVASPTPPEYELHIAPRLYDFPDGTLPSTFIDSELLSGILVYREKFSHSPFTIAQPDLTRQGRPYEILTEINENAEYAKQFKYKELGSIEKYVNLKIEKDTTVTFSNDKVNAEINGDGSISLKNDVVEIEVSSDGEISLKNGNYESVISKDGAQEKTFSGAPNTVITEENGKVTFDFGAGNKTEISASGVKSTTPVGSVDLLTHTHPAVTGPTSQPTPIPGV